MCCTVVVWFMEGIWERFPFTMIKTPWLRRLALFFGIIAISWALCMFFWYMQELVWGDAIRGHRRDAAPDWRWLHVGETAIFFLVPALFLQFYCGNWPNRFSTPINVLVRSLLVTLGGIAIYCLYYKYAHFVLGTQKGFSHPQQFPHDPHDLADQHLADQLVVHGRLAGLAARIQDRRGLRRRGAPSGRQRRMEPRHAARRDHRPRRAA